MMNDVLTHCPEAREVEDNEFGGQSKVVLILCGLVASGKSTFAQALQENFPQFQTCNQDNLGNRKAVEKAAREFLRLGYSICVDRTNFDAAQRSHWIKIARECPGTVVWVIVFDTPFEICAERLRKRTSHPTIKSAEQGLPILARFAKDFRHPDPREGYHCILYLEPPTSRNTGVVSAASGTGTENFAAHYYTKLEISSILQRVRDSPAVLPPRSNLRSTSSPSDPCALASRTSNSSGMSGAAASDNWRQPGHVAHEGSGRSGYSWHGQHGQRGSNSEHPSHSYSSAAPRRNQYNSSQRGRDTRRGTPYDSPRAHSSGQGLGRDGDHTIGASGKE